MADSPPPDSRLDPDILKAVVQIEASGTSKTDSIVGTGFLVSPALVGPSGTRLQFIATNKHVVSDWNPADRDVTETRSSLKVTLYGGPGGPFTTVEIPLTDSSGKPIPNALRYHYDDSADVALVWLNRSDVMGDWSHDGQIFDESFLIPFARLRNVFCGLGDQVFALGYPPDFTSLSTRHPIAKSGYVASVPGEEIHLRIPHKNREKELRVPDLYGKILVVDGLLVKGNSGGPVVTPREMKFRIDELGRFQFTEQPTKNYCVGIVSGGRQSDGLTVVYSCDYIHDVLRQYALVLGHLLV